MYAAVGQAKKSGCCKSLRLSYAKKSKTPKLRRRLLLDAGYTSFEDALGAHLAACDRALRLAAAD